MKISAILPVFNEEESLNPLYTRLSTVLNDLNRECEIIFIEDGSTDKSFETLRQIAERDKRVTVIRFARNYGQTAALQAGFDRAGGDMVVTLDSDLQNNPEDIPALIDKLKETDADVVSGWRSPRKDSLSRRLVSSAANMIISKICGLKLHDYGCTLKVYKVEFVKDLKLFGEMHRFIPAFIHWNGGKVAEIKVSHSHRRHGRSSYGIGRIFRVILDLLTTKFLTTYSTKPIHIFGSLGLVSIFAGVVISIYVSIRRIYFGGEWLSPLFFISVFLLGLGLILILMGVIAEIAVRIYFFQTDNPSYKIKP